MDTKTPTLMRWDKEDFESIEHVRKGISRQLKGLEPCKARGPGSVSPYVLKRCAEMLKRPKEMLEESLEKRVVSREWKRVNVSIYNKGDKEMALNYRPLSLRSVVCKMLEMMIRMQLDYYLQMRKYLSGMQHGFKRKR